MSRRTAWALCAATLGLLLLVTGCGTSLKPARVQPSADASPPATQPTPGPPPPVPKAGDCYRLSYRAATRPTSDARPVPCGQKHTAVTIFVGTIDPIVDGHLLAVDSREVQAQIASTCPAKVPGWIGGSLDDQRLSRFQGIWFSPTLRQSDAGANWFRCDLVAVRGDRQLADLSSTKRALDSTSGLDRFGTCGSSPPDAKGFQPEICAQPHTWRAVSVVPIPRDATYLGPHMQSAGDTACKAQAQQRATDPLQYKWSFQWPDRAAFAAGKRYGLCWVPSTGAGA